MRNILNSQRLPVSPTAPNVLVEKFGLTPITTADADLKALAG